MNDTTPPAPRKSLVSRLLPNPRLIGGIALGAAALGLYLGTKIPGLGLGGGGGVGLGKNPTGDVVISTEGDNGKPPRPKDEKPNDTSARPSTQSATQPATGAAALDVVVEGDGYVLRQGPGRNDYAPVALDEIVRLVRGYPADKEGVRIRVFRRGSALPTAEKRIQEALANAGIPDKEILIVKDLVD